MEEKTYRTVLSYIRGKIQSRELSVGDRLPTERSLSAELSISRNTVRDAMRVLESMGIVESRQGSGNYLAARMDHYLSEALQFLLLLSQLSYLEINQLRRAIELEGCRLALEMRTEKQLKQMAVLLEHMESAPPEERIAADQQFHQTVLESSGNHLLVLMMDALSEVCGSLIAGLTSALSPENDARLLHIHREFLTALGERRCEDALEAVRRHYDIADQALIQWEKQARVSDTIVGKGEMRK